MRYYAFIESNIKYCRAITHESHEFYELFYGNYSIHRKNNEHERRKTRLFLRGATVL